LAVAYSADYCRGSQVAPKKAGHSSGCLADHYLPEADQVGYSPADGSAVHSPVAQRSAVAYLAGCSVAHTAEHCRPRDRNGCCSAADPAGYPRCSPVVLAVLEAPSSRVPQPFSAEVQFAVLAKRQAAGLRFAGWQLAVFPLRPVGAVAQSWLPRHDSQSAQADALTLAALPPQTPAALAPWQEF
jgi:hypothetical protein